MSTLWQHPFVNVFKEWKVGEWKQASRRGRVTRLLVSVCLVGQSNRHPFPAPVASRGVYNVQDNTIGRLAFRIRGTPSTEHFIEIPKCVSAAVNPSQ